MPAAEEQAAAHGHSRAAVRATGNRKDRERDADSPRNGAQRDARRHIGHQDLLVWRKRKTHQRSVYPIPAAVRKEQGETHPAVQRGRRHILETQGQQQQQCGTDGECHSEHHPGRDGDAGRHTDSNN